MLRVLKKIIGINKKSALIRINNNSCDKKIAKQLGGNYCQD
ncbi:MAG: hypothetical protein Q4G05_04125 [Clostridia bacterium]|nr:hypothetical protein [Clostridia bacterium]